MLTVQASITKADETNIEADTAGLVNLAFHFLSREVSVKIYEMHVSKPNQNYLYRASIETVLTYCKEVQKN